MQSNTENGNQKGPASLPHPRRERWQPLRSGFLNLYRYDREEFHYESGRLLLRGNNGTGKSRVLALQLPFLLDGEVIPQRLEPDADPAKRVEWNLLMGRYPDRTGYTWIEFGRRDSEGKEYYLTLGCGLSAAEGHNGVRQWFFISTQRIGIDLELAGEGGRQVLGKDRLRDRIGSAGQVFEAAGAYRKAVNEALFRLDEHRYASLINLLIQLRRPQLTRRLEEDELSGALSEALPPVSPAVIENIAEALKNLETDRSRLESSKTALNAVDRFLGSYRSYVRIAAKRAVDRVRTAHYDYETAMKEILLSEADCDRSLADLSRLKAEIQRLSTDQVATEAEITAFQQSPDIRNAEAVERARQEAADKRKEAESAAVELANAVQIRKNCAEEYVRAKGVVEERQSRLEGVVEAAAHAASTAGLSQVHLESAGALDLTQTPDASLVQDARQRLDVAIQKQLEKCYHLRRLTDRIVQTRSELQDANSRRDHLFGLLDDARERSNVSQQEHKAAIHSFLTRIQEWRSGLTELRLGMNDEIQTSITDWCAVPIESNPVQTITRTSLDQRTTDLAEQRSHLQLLQQSQTTALNELKEERDRMASGGVMRVSWSSPRAHSTWRDQPGAPFWLLCDFVEGFDATLRGAIEGALEASGLLHAWVTPTGDLVDADSEELILAAASGPLPADDEHLGTILVPCAESSDIDCPVPSYVVADILRQIGAKPNAGYTWVSTDGRWQTGLLQGSRRKPEAEHLGSGSREQARQRRVRELDSAISDAQTQMPSLIASIDELDRRDRMVRAEANLMPSHERLCAAYFQAEAAAREVDALRNRLAETEENVSLKRSRLDEVAAHHDSAVADLGIATSAEGLNILVNGITSYRIALSGLWSCLELLADARTASSIAWKHVEGTAVREARQKEITDRLEIAASSAEIARDAMTQAMDSDFAQTLDRLDLARRRLDEIRTHEKEVQRQHHDTELMLTRVDERLRNLTEMLNGQTERRNTAAASLRAFAGTRLLHLAVPDVVMEDTESWSTNRAVEVAFGLTSRLDSIESGDTVWEHSQKTVPSQFNDLMQALSPQGFSPSGIFGEGVFIATALLGSRQCTMDELHHILSEDVRDCQLLLDGREKEILENHLVGEVCSHLQQRLYAAESQVEEMNIELDGRPTSTGMKLRFVWRPAEDSPLGLSEIRNCLMQPSHTWSSADCRLLGTFIQQQIHAVCAQTDSGNAHDYLAEALDYRKWHRFGVERHQDGVWKRLTRRTHGTGSGGEKAVALTLPYFAAAAAFYRTADPCAPRLILLDEAFVGIDADMRSKCMGLIHTFDLDFMMTSEREWGCYQTLPGLAVYQLSTQPGIDAISLTRWVWNGNQRSLERNTSNTEDTVTTV